MYKLHRNICLITIASCALGLSACGDAAPSPADDGGTAAGGSDSTSTSSGQTGGQAGGFNEPGAPAIESLTTSSDLFAPNAGDTEERVDMVTFTAVVTDPDGQSDVADGLLTDEDGTAYGTFLKSGGGSTYVAELAWHDFVALSGTTFDKGGADFTFVVRFRDTAGHEASSSVSVRLSCGWDELALCEGQCQQLDTDDHCGACGQSCNCENGNCVEYTCGTAPGIVSCGDICQGAGLTCSDSFCETAGYLHRDTMCGDVEIPLDSCATSTIGDGNSFECCCV